jgi:MFS family permease
MFAIGGANVGLAVYLPVYGEAYLGLTPAQSGYALLGYLVGTVTGSTIGGRLTMRIVHVKRISLIGAVLCTVGFIAMGLSAGQTSLVVLETLLVIVGFGMGLNFPVITVSVQNGVDHAHLGIATGMLTFLRSLGAALGVAALGAIALGYGIPLGGEAGGGMPHVSDPAPFAALFHTMAAMMLLATLLNILMPHKPLRGRAQVAAEP